MFKRAAALFLFLLLSFVVCAESLSGFPWNAGVDEVKAQEEIDPLYETSSFIVYETTLFGRKVQKIYSFDENRLTSIIYIFYELPSELKGYLHDYEAVSEELEAALGTPLDYMERWEDERFKVFPELALTLGDLSFTAFWLEGSDSLVTHSLYANDLSINHVIYINPLMDIFLNFDLNEEFGEDADEEAAPTDAPVVPLEEADVGEESDFGDEPPEASLEPDPAQADPDFTE